MFRHKLENYNFNNNFFLPLRCLSHKSAEKNNDKVNDPDRRGVQPEKTTVAEKAKSGWLITNSSLW